MKNETKPNRAYVYRMLEEMNLTDDFLLEKVVSSPEHGETFCRLLLGILFNKEIRKLRVTTQKVYSGINRDKRGARMDVIVEESADGEIFETSVDTFYDIEPEKKVSARQSLPKRVRFYRAKQDSRFLKTGDDPGRLPKAYTIMFMPFDPFGLGRMVYSIRNVCTDAPEIDYDDGAETIFLNCGAARTDVRTKGAAIDDSSETVEALLHFLSNTKKELAVTEDLNRINEIVDYVRHDEEVSTMYFRYEEHIADARNEGLAMGIEQGIEQGLSLGDLRRVTSLVRKKVLKGYELSRIAEELEEDSAVIEPVYDAVLAEAPDYDEERILARLQ